MNKRQILASLNNIANTLDHSGFNREADTITKVMVKLAEEETESYGNEPDKKIIDDFVDQAKRNERYDPSILKMMNDRLEFNGHERMSEKKFMEMIEEAERQNIILSWRKHVEKGDMSRGSAARMATQQLRMKFPNAKLITETEIEPLRFPDNGGRFGDESGAADQDGLKPTYMDHPIVKEYVDLVSRYKMDKEEAYAEMNEKLKAIGQRPYLRSAFDGTVDGHRHMISTLDYQGPGGPLNAKNMSPEEFRRWQKETSEEMSERHKKMGYQAPSYG
jgi:hypothetical protein